MNERIRALRDYILEKRHHALRVPDEADISTYRDRALPDHRRTALRLRAALAAEVPTFLPGERIALTRTRPAPPPIFSEDEWADIRSSHYIHELGNVSNLSPDYGRVMAEGLVSLRDRLSNDTYADSMRISIDAVLDLAARYATASRDAGLADVADALDRVPALPPRGFREALQSLRVLHYAMWCEGDYHNTLGRFDQYMYPYLKDDLDAGALAPDEAQELLEEFFLSLNRDSDLYPGMQQGDNGQSMVLGGLTREGADGFNLLSEMCLRASLALKVIDPKINLRVHRDTQLSAYESGTQLTRVGLGFPQYENDEVVVPGLVALGYAPQDARDYVVAACWEFIIPGKGMEIPNIAAMPLAAVAQEAIRESLPTARDMSDITGRLREILFERAREIAGAVENLYVIPSPYLSLFFEGCAEHGRDISLGCVYNNYGMHGTGLATAVDSLAAVEKMVFERGLKPELLLQAMELNFEGFDELRYELRERCPKMGNDDEAADRYAVWLLGAFADALEPLRNERGGRFRAGTGSAMYYIWHAKDIGATADGRAAESPLPANYAPSLGARVNGPTSILRSFAKPDLSRVINGGPLTIEFHDSAFRNDDAIRKVAMLVRHFMSLGGHQLQLNTLNRERLLEAQLHPEAHRNLIVRVWGWSGYFVELDKCYQDHIIKRVELTL